MFSGASSFSQDLGQWGVGVVTDMEFMFHDAGTFDADLSGWGVTSIPAAPTGFD